MRPLFVLLGFWHAVVSAIAGLYGGYLLLTSLTHWYGGDAIMGALLIACGLIAVPSLTLVAQGGKGVRGAGAALALPFFLLSLWAADLSFWYGGHVWRFVVPFVPGALIGAVAMMKKETA